MRFFGLQILILTASGLQIPTNISPTNISPTNISPTNISPTNISPTNITPTNITPNAQPQKRRKSEPSLPIFCGIFYSFGAF